MACRRATRRRPRHSRPRPRHPQTVKLPHQRARPIITKDTKTTKAMNCSSRIAFVSLAGFVALSGARGGAQFSAPLDVPPPGKAAAERLPILEDVGVDQHLNGQLPLDTPFVDEQGRDVMLGDFFGTRPVVLVLAYYNCPMLCTLVLNGSVAALQTLSFDAGKEFEFVVVSFDPGDTPSLAQSKKASYLPRYGRPRGEAGFHFLTGRESLYQAADVGRRVQVRLRPGDSPVRASGAHHRPDARRQDFTISVRHRFPAVRLAAGAGRSGQRQDWHEGRSGAALLLPLRPGERPIWHCHSERRPGGRHCDASGDLACSCGRLCAGSGGR